jgi:tartrate dehydrogenase/decarboxylase/D-malate dehydrogenase
MLGSIGISPSGNINPEGKYPSMFEPIHGSAPDIAGKGIANPMGTFWAISLMLEHLGCKPEADKVMEAMIAVLTEGKALTRDIGGNATTTEMTDAILSKI